MFKKDDTLAAKGIAILFLYGYHCFSSRQRLGGYEVIFSPLSQKTAMWLCESMNFCVAMFAFLSVYGFTVIAKKQLARQEMSPKDYAKFSINRYISLISTFLIPFILCEVVSHIVGTSAYGTGRIERLGNALFDLLGLSMFFGTPILCGTWWYMSLAVLLIFLFPIFFILYRKINIAIIPLTALMLQLSVKQVDNMNKFLFVIPIAIWCADEDIFYKIKSFKSDKPVWNILKKVLAILLICVLCYVRKSKWGLSYLRLIINCLIAPIMIYLIYDLTSNSKIIKKILAFLGKHSGNMFFVHTFIRWVWLKDFTYSLKYAWLIILFLLATTIAISILIELFKKAIKLQEKVRKLESAVNKII